MTPETLLKYTITADASKLKAEIAGVDKALKASGGTLSSVAGSASKEWGSLDGVIGKVKGTIGGIPVPAGAAAGAIAGIGAATLGAAAGAVALGKAMFDIAKSGSDFGRNIGSFESKTGLTAQTVSALAYAAKLSGKELSDLQRPMIAFTGALGKAQVAGSEASKALEKLGITDTHNLDAALTQAFAALNKMPDGIDKMNVAAMLFGKRGGLEMINFAKKTGSSFDEFKAKAEALGVVLSEQEVQHAKEFGHAFETLGYQIEAVAAKFGIEWAPTFTHGMESISSSITRNKRLIDHAIESSGDLLRGIAVISTDSTTSSVASWTWWAVSLMNNGFLPVQKGAELATDALRRLGAAQRGLEVGGKVGAGLFGSTTFGKLGGVYGTSKITGLPGEDDGTGGGGRGGSGKAKEHPLSPQAQSIISHANNLGISALDFATLLLYEGAGKLSTSIMGGKGGKYMGSMQMGPWEQKHYGVTRGMPWDSYLDKASQYLTDRGVRPGADLLTLYKAVNGGNVNVSANASDGSGTIAQHVARMLAKNRGQASALLKGGEKADQWGGEYAKLLKEAQDAADKVLKIEEAAAKRAAELSKTQSDAIVADYEREYKAAVALYDPEAATVASEKIARVRRQQIDDEITALEERIGFVKRGSEEEKDLLAQIATKKIEAGEAQKKIDDERDERWPAIEGIYEAQINYELALKKAAQDRLDILNEQIQIQATAPGYDINGQPNTQIGSNGLPGVAGIDQSQMSALDQLGSVMEQSTGLVGSAQLITGAFQQMGQAVGSAVESFVLYGKVGQSVRQVTAQILASIAQQAAVQAIYELAQGFAMLALAYFGYYPAGPSATEHFAAAGMFGLIAGATAGIGRGVAGGSFNQANAGAAGIGSGNFGTGGSSSGSNAPLTTYSRTSSNAYISGRDPAIHALTQTVQDLSAKIGSMSPDQVLTTAANQRPGIFVENTIREVENNSSHGTRLLRASGYR